MSMVVDPSAVTLGEAGDWQAVCPATSLPLDRGVAAIFGNLQVAVFQLSTGGVYALDNRDPFSGANVMSRGLVGHTKGHLKVTSPMYKQSFDFETGVCTDDPSVCIRMFPTEVRNGVVYVYLAV